MAQSGFWKFTAIISMGDRSKSSSLCWTGSTSLGSALLQANAWAAKLALTLGNGGSGGIPDQNPSAASPYIRFIRITDAQFPRFGRLIRTDGSAAWFGQGNGTSDGLYGADFAATALSLRLLGGTTVLGPFSYANHALVGVPDAVVVRGDQVNLAPATGFVAPYSGYVQQYLNWIFNATNSMGIMVVNRTLAPDFQTGAFAPGGGRWTFLPGVTGWIRGDRIRIRGCNAPGFNGSYIIDVDATGLVISLNSGPPQGIPAPTRGIAYRYQLASGVKVNQFAQLYSQIGQTTPPFGLVVAKRNPARAFTGVSFRRRPRRIHS